MSEKIENVIIIGSGPAGHTAAIYASRAQLEPLMLEGEFAGGVAAGGQLTTTTDVENFPGFPEGVQGPELMFKMREQSEKYGTRILTKTVDSVDFSASPFKVRVGDTTYLAKTIIIATGATAKKLEAPGVEEYWQKGISACAVCDGGLPIFRNKPLVVVGGGDTACEEAIYLSKFGSEVIMLVRRDEMRASKVMQERAIANEKIRVMWNTELDSVEGDQLMTNVIVRNNKDNSPERLNAQGLFFAIGHEPNVGFLNGALKTDESGYIITNNGSPETDIPGVYACGDVQDRIYRQAITAAGSGCMAALLAERFLAH